MIELAQRTVPAVLVRGASHWPDKTAVLDETTELTYARLRESTARVAGGLRALGVQPRDAVALLLSNSVDHVLSWFALSWLNAVEVAVNTALKPDQVAAVVNHSGAATVIVDEAYLPLLRAAAPGLAAVRTVVVRGDVSAASGLPFRVVGFDEVRAAAEVEAEPVGPHDVLGIVYTSGTTGLPKGIEVTQAQTYGRMWPGGPGGPVHEDRTLVVLPMYHVIGQCRGLYNSLIVGGTAVLVPRFSASGFWELARRHSASFVPLVGAMVGYLLNQPARADDRDHPVRHVALGTTSPLVSDFRQRFGIAEISMSYGLTEAGGVLVAPAEPSGCGYLRDDFEARLVDEHDVEVAAGDVGELVLRPHEPWTVMRGYYRMPDATLQRWRNLWLHTDDLMYQRPDGMYVFAGRRSDRIRIKGENVSVAEVEHAVAEYPPVAECAVTGVPSTAPEAGAGDEEILAAVVARAGETVRPAELIEFLALRLPGYAVPRFVAVVAELPRTDATHRVQRNVLAALPDTERWDRWATGTGERR
ncbi:AMP-binding protein [Dactylosporangium sp. CA-092794]|uniref:AMP-binding protein n=1 Tax=Dactylosporangium sp. CA-092794 TaxID=3239929 RepID=UPI003D8B05D1